MAINPNEKLAITLEKPSAAMPSPLETSSPEKLASTYKGRGEEEVIKPAQQALDAQKTPVIV